MEIEPIDNKKINFEGKGMRIDGKAPT